MTINGEPLRFRLDPDTPLLWALRDASNLAGTKYGCDSGDCGACTVLVDGRATLSCRTAIASLEGANVTTIEGLSAGHSNPVQLAWLQKQVSQCGRCDPGYVIALAGLIATNPQVLSSDLDRLPNRCRCGSGGRVAGAMKQLAKGAHAAPVSKDITTSTTG